MNKRLIAILVIMMVTLLLPLNPNIFANYYDNEIPEAPFIEWDDTYSTSYSSQRVTMSVRTPENADKIRFYLFANDDVYTREKKVSSYDNIVSQTFGSLLEEQEVWGYAVAYDRQGIKTPNSEWASEYIGKRSNRAQYVDIPYEPYIDWLDEGRNTSNSQRVQVTADLPRDAKYIKYFLICNGTVKESGRTQNESYTFTGVHYDQMVIAYVRIYDGYGDVSPQSPTTTLYIGEDISYDLSPPIPQVQWLDQGLNNPYGQQVLMRVYLPYPSIKIRYFLLSGGTVLSSPITTEDNYIFYNVKDNQTVTGYVQIYDNNDRPSAYSQQVSISIPNRTQSGSIYEPVQPPVTQPGGTGAKDDIPSQEGRIIISDRGISIKDFKLPSLWINSPFHFEDIDVSDSELHQALQYCYSTRLLENEYKSEFYPNSPMTRIDFLNATLKAAALYERQAEYGSNYVDIYRDYPYYNQVLFAGQEGIMNGYPDYAFKPDNGITYGVAMKALVNAFKIRRYKGYEESLVDNIEQHYIDIFLQAGIINTAPSNPNQELTRANAIRILYRIMSLKMQQ